MEWQKNVKIALDYAEQYGILYSRKTDNHDERLPEGFRPEAMPLLF